MLMMSEMPMEPYVERYEYDECRCCHKQFVVYDEVAGANPDVRYAWWEDEVLCSDECLKKYLDEYEYDMLEEFDDDEIESLKREAIEKC